ncbi:hypothetical protein ACFPM0_34140 [Pseudonocardia sulfidoxydans]
MSTASTVIGGASSNIRSGRRDVLGAHCPQRSEDHVARSLH